MDEQFLQDGDCVAESECVKPDPYHTLLKEMLPAVEVKGELLFTLFVLKTIYVSP